MDKTGSKVEADKRDETDELADMDRKLVNCGVHTQYMMAENHALAKRSHETDITGEKESITVGGGRCTRQNGW